eukprot:364840-Pelagomonas_calceolata.AAC.1
MLLLTKEGLWATGPSRDPLAEQEGMDPLRRCEAPLADAAAGLLKPLAFAMHAFGRAGCRGPAVFVMSCTCTH